MTSRLTKKRQQILDVLKSSKDALSAKEVHTRLSETDLVTVYRALDFLVKARLVTALHFDTETKYEFQKTPHHHAICKNCSKIIHFSTPSKQLETLLKVEDFCVEEVEVTVRGTCKHSH